MTNPRLHLEEPLAFLVWLDGARKRGVANLDEVEVAQVFAIAATAALARTDQAKKMKLLGDASGPSRFAHALGLDEVLTGGTERDPTERIEPSR